MEFLVGGQEISVYARCISFTACIEIFRFHSNVGPEISIEIGVEQQIRTLVWHISTIRWNSNLSTRRNHSTHILVSEYECECMRECIASLAFLLFFFSASFSLLVACMVSNSIFFVWLPGLSLSLSRFVPLSLPHTLGILCFHPDFVAFVRSLLCPMHSFHAAIWFCCVLCAAFFFFLLVFSFSCVYLLYENCSRWLCWWLRCTRCTHIYEFQIGNVFDCHCHWRRGCCCVVMHGLKGIECATDFVRSDKIENTKCNE